MFAKYLRFVKSKIVRLSVVAFLTILSVLGGSWFVSMQASSVQTALANYKPAVSDQLYPFADPSLENQMILTKNPDGSGNLALSDRDELTRLFEDVYAKNLRTGDVNSYVAMFTKDAFWMPPGSPDRRGLKEIGEAFGMQAKSVNLEPKLTAEEVQVMGNFSYIIGSSLATISPKDGSQAHKAKLRVVWLLRKEEGAWKIAREIWNLKPM